MKYLIFFVVSMIGCKGEKSITKTQKATEFLKILDSTTGLLGPPAFELVSYFKQIDSTVKNQEYYQIESHVIDTLEFNYDALIFEYNNAIKNISSLKTFDGLSDLIKQNYLIILEKGKEPWHTVIPVYIKLLRNGPESFSSSEVYIIDSLSLIFQSSANNTREWSKIVSIQMEELKMKYNVNSNEFY